MKEKPAETRRSGCPISILLEILGDTWSLLIVRDMMFYGRCAYNEFLNAGEKIATNILSDRLQRLETADIIEKRRDPSDARKFIYRLTERGIDLAPMLVEMILWSAQHEDTDAPPEVIAAMQKDRAGFIAKLRQDQAQSA
ncbi:MAG: winged helix-turn-helix transcriptional regulator [Pseudomonadota bacterium]